MSDSSERGSSELISAGVDWMTCTALFPKSSIRLRTLAELMLQKEKRAGNDVSPWGMAGFDGMMCGQIQVGTRDQQTLVRVSSDLAHSTWRRLYCLCDNVSRLDIEATYIMQAKPGTVVAKAYGQAARFSRKSVASATVSTLRTAHGPATLYIGKRSSDLFARCYDKSSEGGPAWPKGAVRFELELKGKQANLTVKRLYESSATESWVDSRLRSYFVEHGVDYPGPPDSPSNYSCPRTRPDVDRRLLWLATHVRPSIELVINEVGRDRVLEALGIAMNTHRKRAIRKIA